MNREGWARAKDMYGFVQNGDLIPPLNNRPGIIVLCPRLIIYKLILFPKRVVGDDLMNLSIDRKMDRGREDGRARSRAIHLWK